MADINISKKILATIGASAGAGITAFTTMVFAYIDTKVDDVNKRVEDKYVSVKEYVDTRHSAVEDKLSKIEGILIRIEDRVYKLKQKED